LVYFAQAAGGGPVKIGYCAEGALERRIGALRGACPFPLTVTRTLPGATRADERELHRRFRRSRLHGEWFYPDPDVAAEARGVDEAELRRTVLDAADAILKAAR
jgi:hypothetical protein